MGAATKYPEGSDPTTAEVIEMFARRPLGPSSRATSAELAQYRRLLPRIMQMLDEWEAVKGSGGCPIARRITNPTD